MAFQNKNQTNDLLNYYLTMNMNNICRICLEKSNKLTPVFDPIKPPHFSVLIMACASVQVQEGDGLPPYICQRCISRLNIAFQFKTQCESSDTKLRQCFENYSLQQAPDYTGFEAKEEGSISEPNSSENDAIKETSHTQNKQTQVDESQYGSDLTSDQTVFVPSREVDEDYKDIPIDIVPVQHPLPQIAEQVSFKIQPDEAYEEDITSTVKLEDLNIHNVTDVKPDIRKPKRPAKVHQCNTCQKIFRTKPSLIHHVRIHTGERPYVCHLCHKRFVNGGHLHTHMKTHTGEKNHVCAACSKGFATSQQLTKHTIAIHTSERPYGCTYCAKRFASSSNLNTHIKTHTGEKNFHCEICGKTFSTKGQLQQHLLIHTGEKSFLCEYCNKRFSQKAHLLRHLRIHSKTD